MPESSRLPPPPRIAVVGGGVSGLAAAQRLQRLLPHAQVQLFEAGDRLGGPLHTLRTSDSILEQGADSLLIKTPWALDLCRELGLADQLIPTNEQHRRALVVRNGKLIPVPDGFVLMRPQDLGAILRSPLLSPVGKLRLLAEPLVHTPAGVNRPNYDESVASFATRRLGRETYERLVQPLIAGVFVADARRLSLRATFPEFLEAEREYGSLLRSARADNAKLRLESESSLATSPAASPQPSTAAARYGQFVTLRRGLSALIEALAESLPPLSIRLRTPVWQISRHASQRWTLKTSPGAPLEHFDGVILAMPAPRSGQLLEVLDPGLAGDLSRIEFASSAVVTLIYPRQRIAHPLDGFGVVVPEIEKRPIVAASFLTVKFPDHAPADHAVIRVFFGGVLHPELVERSDNELLAIARHELMELIGVQGEPMEVYITRWRQSMPQYRVGHLDLVSDIENRIAAHRGLELAGNSYRGVGIPQSIHSGRTAAERLAMGLGRLADQVINV